MQSNQNGDTLCFEFHGSWTIHANSCSTADITKQFPPHIKNICFKTQQLNDWDSRLLVELSNIMEHAASHSIAVDLHELPAGVRKLIRLTQKKTGMPPRKKYSETGLFEEIGKQSIGVYQQIVEMLAFTGDILLSYVRLFTKRARFLKKTSYTSSMIVALRLFQL